LEREKKIKYYFTGAENQAGGQRQYLKKKEKTHKRKQSLGFRGKNIKSPYLPEKNKVFGGIQRKDRKKQGGKNNRKWIPGGG